MTIPQDADGHIDLDALSATLVTYADRPLRIGSFSAASNVTGIVSNTVAVSEILHEHGALSFWDFAAAAPYVDIEMYPAREEHPLAWKDAVFLSPHKFIGGPSTPGVLVARRELFGNRVPDVPGGGTVAYVNDADHAYLPDAEHREEGGTPAIIGAITYDAHGMHAPSSRLAGDESLLAQHLVDGERILREAPEPDLTPPTTMTADFEHLRWFDLPRVSVEG